MGVGMRVAIGKLDGVQEDRPERCVKSPPLHVDPLWFEDVVDELPSSEGPAPFAIDQVLPTTTSPSHSG